MKRFYILILVLLVLSACSNDVTFKYKLSTTNRISKESINNVYNYTDDLISNHTVEYNYLFNGCTYDDLEGLNFSDDKTSLYNYQNEIINSNQSQDLSGLFLFFYVGYFHDFTEAIYFAETNLDAVNNFINSESKDDQVNRQVNYINYDYRIDKICDTEHFGYLVSFGTLDKYIITNDFGFTLNNESTTQNYINSLIKNDQVLSKLNTFFAFEVYLGNIKYMHFEIPNLVICQLPVVKTTGL